ncbi:hypothetical protein C0J52_13332 [Blattella germanica]|nr:hypothetical protein C0J52_13332 [Blattella germanica]
MVRLIYAILVEGTTLGRHHFQDIKERDVGMHPNSYVPIVHINVNEEADCGNIFQQGISESN